MRQPNILVRFAGTPLIACLLIAGAGFVVYDWYQGQLVWWLALAVVWAMLRTLAAVATMRRYKRWRTEWEAMERIGGGPRPSAKPNPWRRAMLIGTVLIAIPLAAPVPVIHDTPVFLGALQWTWGLLAVYALVLLVRGTWRSIGSKMRRAQEARTEKSFDDPISIAPGVASDCPTRADAERNLPDYCRLLIDRS